MAEFLQSPFGSGFICGFLAAVALAILAFWLNIWLKSIKSFFMPQVVISTTQKSPFGVLMQAVGQTILFTAITLLVLSVIYIHYFR